MTYDKQTGTAENGYASTRLERQGLLLRLCQRQQEAEKAESGRGVGEQRKEEIFQGVAPHGQRVKAVGLQKKDMRKQSFSGAQEHNGLVYIVHCQLGNTTIQGFACISFQMARLIAQALDNDQQMVEARFEMGTRTARGD